MSVKSYVFATATLLAVLVGSFAAFSFAHDVFAQEATQTEDANSKSLGEQLIGTWEQAARRLVINAGAVCRFKATKQRRQFRQTDPSTRPKTALEQS